MEEKDTTKQSWQSLAFILAGSVISVPGLILGGTLITNLSFWESLGVALLGYGIVVVLMVLQGMQSADLKEPTVKVASHVFGKVGSQKIVSILLAISCLGWFGIQGNVAGQTFTNFLAIYDIHLPVAISSLFWGIIMLISALYGIRLLRLLNTIAVPILLVVIGYGVLSSMAGADLSVILNHQGQGGLSFYEALAITVGSFALGAVIGGDYTQYSKSRKDVIKACVVGVFPTGVLMIIAGMILTVTSGSSDVTQAFLSIGSPVLGVIALILATWTTNATNAFSGGVALVHVFNIPPEKERLAVGIAGSVGTLLAVIGILDYFEPIMSLLSAMIPPVGGVMIASYWLVHKGDQEKWHPVAGVNWYGIISWLVGAVVAAVPVVLSFFPTAIQLPNQPLIGIVLSLFTYLIFAKGTSAQMIREEI